MRKNTVQNIVEKRTCKKIVIKLRRDLCREKDSYIFYCAQSVYKVEHKQIAQTETVEMLTRPFFCFLLKIGLVDFIWSLGLYAQKKTLFALAESNQAHRYNNVAYFNEI